MNKLHIALTTIGLLGCISSNAQNVWTPGTGTDITTTTPGNVYIKGGLLDMSMTGADPFRSLNCGSAAAGLYLCTGTTTLDGTYIQLHAPNETDNGAMQFVSNSSGALGSGFSFSHHDFTAGTDNALMNLSNWGKLSVNGALINLTSAALGSDSWRAINCGSSTAGLWVNTGSSATDGTYIQMHAPGEKDPGAMQFVSNSSGALGSGFSFNHHDFTSGTDNALMSLSNWGKMSVKGGLINLTTDALGTDSWRALNCGSNKAGLWVNTGNTTTDGTYIQMHAAGESTNAGGIEIVCHTVAGTGTGITFGHYDGSLQNDMRINSKGKVIIGNGLIATNNTPNNYLLYVEKGILTEKLKVANSTDPMNWADFVFNEDYQLRPLTEVEHYIKANKHLPEIPTANDVAQNGIDVAEMDAKLLQKIEELTLYVIQQQKEINELKARASK